MVDEKIRQAVEDAFQAYVRERAVRNDEDMRIHLHGRLYGMKRLLKAMGIEFSYCFKCGCDPYKEDFLEAPCPCPSFALKGLKESAPC